MDSDFLEREHPLPNFAFDCRCGAMMRRSLLSLVAICLGGFWCGNARAEPAIDLPADPAAPVVEMWYVDHGQLQEPEVSIFANGRIRVRIGEGSIWGQLEPAEVNQLVETLLHQDGLANMSTRSLNEAIRTASDRSGLSCHIPGAGDSIIRIHTSTKTYRVDAHAVGILATRFPDIVELQHYYAAQCHLENIRAIIMVGGTGAAEELARLAQNRLQSEYGETIPVRSGDLSVVRSMADGTRYCQFLVRGSENHSQPRVISLFQSPGEAPRVSVLPDGPRVQ
jgi:hypothetical protein